jgi:hypothetical protein
MGKDLVHAKKMPLWSSLVNVLRSIIEYDMDPFCALFERDLIFFEFFVRSFQAQSASLKFTQFFK